MEVEEEEEEKLGQNQPQKRMKIIEDEENKDRISVLPDGILAEILSHLDDTKEVIRTGTLSKRWKYIWTCVRTLNFEYNAYHYYTKNITPIPGFLSYIDETLSRRGHSKLTKFRLDTPYEPRFQSQVSRIIRCAINCDVEDLSLSFWKKDYFKWTGQFIFDDYFYINSCITHLTLEGCLLNTTRVINWKTLRSLYIKQGILNEHLVENILSGSPVLETLKLEYCFGYGRLDITSTSVKNLVISGCTLLEFSGYCDDFKHTLEINAPNILSLVIDRTLGLLELSLLDVSSLLNVDLNYTMDFEYVEEKEKILKGIILSLPRVTEVQIGMSCFQVPDVTSPESSDDDSQ